jgi:hypothetical protein
MTSVTPIQPANVAMRIPGWTPRETLVFTLNGAEGSAIVTGDYANVKAAAGDTVTMAYDLPETHEVETTDGVDYAFTWRGDRVHSVSPVDTFLPFYRGAALPPLSATTK